MSKGSKAANVAAKPSRAGNSNQSAVRGAAKDPNDESKPAGPRRSARIEQKAQLALELSQKKTAGSSASAAVPAKASTAKKAPARKTAQKQSSQSHRKGAKKGQAAGNAIRRQAKSTEPAIDPHPEPVPDDDSVQSKRVDRSASSRGHQIGSSKDLERVNSGLNAAQERDTSGTSERTYVDPREDFDIRYGYLPPLDEETSRIIAVVMSDPDVTEKINRITLKSLQAFEGGLKLRRVDTDPSPLVDPQIEGIKSKELEDTWLETDEQRDFCENLWRQDNTKVKGYSNEAIFQRTVMLNLLGRHRLIYRKQSDETRMLDYNAEDTWGCLPMPSKALWKIKPNSDIDQKLLTKPKPDLAVCFRREAVIDNDLWEGVPPATEDLMCFENQTSGKSRIFHFLTVEAKNSAKSLEDPRALYQSLNNASQALHNIYEFFNDAGAKHKQIFFDKVRFFSVVANTSGVIIRIHKATEMKGNVNSNRLVMPDRPEYNLKFEFSEFGRFTGEDGFKREKVIEAFAKIFKYAVDELGSWISDAARDLLGNLSTEQYDVRRSFSFYRHGQPYPVASGTKSKATSKGGSKNTSNAGSQSTSQRESRAVSQSRTVSPFQLNQDVAGFQINSNQQSFNMGPPSGQVTPRADYPPSGSTKRTSNQAGAESSTNGQDPRSPAKRAKKPARTA